MISRESSSERAERSFANPSATGARPSALFQRAVRSYWVLSLVIVFSCVAGAAATRSSTTAKPGATYAFANNTVIDIARRTVAKYREQLGILSSSKRKRVF